MSNKISEVEIHQMIIEETKKIVQEKSAFDVLKGAGYKSMGRAAGGGLLRGGAGLLWKGVSRFAWPLALLELGNLAESWWYGTADPDELIIMKMASDETSQKMQDAMLEYSELYFKFIQEVNKIIFAPGKMDVFAQAKEYIPTFGLDRLFGGEDNLALTLTVDYTPNNPSAPAKYRRGQFFEAANKILIANTPITKSVVQSGPIAAELRNLVDKTVDREYDLIRYNQVSDRAPMNEIEADKRLKSMADEVAKKAAEVNELFRTGVSEAVETKAQEEVEAGKDPETAKETAKKAVATTTTSRYSYLSKTVNDVLKKGFIVVPFSKTLVDGLIGQVQGHLQTAGYKIGKDGYFGPRTLEALQDFQKNNGLKVTGKIDKETLQELIATSIDKELEGLERGESLPIRAKQAGQQTELASDDLPFPLLKGKIERLQDLLSRVEGKRKAKVEARLNRAKQALERKLLNYAARQQAKGDKKMNEEIDEATLRNIIQEELNEITSPDTDVTGPALVRMLVSFVKKYIYDALMASALFGGGIFISQGRKLDSRARAGLLRSYLAIVKPSYQSLKALLMAGPTAECGDLAEAIQDFFVATADALQKMLKERYHTAETYEEARIAHRVLKEQLNKYYSEMCSQKERPPQEIEFDPVVVTPEPKPSTGGYRTTNLTMDDIKAGKGVYKMGLKGGEIDAMQALLGVKSDGIFGPGTRKAVMDFQRERGLRVDGIFGKNTYNALVTDKAAIRTPAKMPAPVAPELAGAPSPTAKFGLGEGKEEALVSESVKDRWQKIIKG